MIISSFVLLNCYLIVLLFLYKGFQRLLPVPSTEISVSEVPTVSFTIIIPFRNEAFHVPELVASLNLLKFNKNSFEIIFVNDESTDASVRCIMDGMDAAISYSILDNVLQTNSPKKDAITLAVSKAKGRWIITTDADCTVPETWLSEFEKAIHMFDPKMLCAPVMIARGKGLLHRYQQADFLSLQGVTMGSFGAENPVLCNGANLAFEKSAFNAVQGYEGNSHLASGDDIFMLQKMKAKFPDKIHFMKSKEATVTTQAVVNWTALIKQRIRWASKTATVGDKNAMALGIIVFTVNFLCIVFLILGLLTYIEWYTTLSFILIKISADTLFILKIKRFLNAQISGPSILICGCIYPFITCFVTLKSLFPNYNWKGRSY